MVLAQISLCLCLPNLPVWKNLFERRVAMTKWQRFKHELFLIRHDFTDWLRSVRRRIWNKRLKLWWYQLFVRKDEFHHSLSTDPEAMMVMSEKELERYYTDLGRRRAVAHKRDLAREDAGER